MTTMKDVAKSAGVSVATVSNVINDTGFVSAETKKYILNQIDRLGYRRNYSARSLKTGSTATLAVAVPDLSNNYFAKILSGIEKVTSQNGYQVIVSGTEEDPDKEEDALRNFLSNQVQSLIWGPASHTPPTIIEEYKKNNIPVVLIDRMFSAFSFPYVGVNNTELVKEAVTHLVDIHGHQNISYISGDPDLSTSLERLRGFKTVIKEKGIETSCTSVVSDSTIAGGYQAALSLLYGEVQSTAIIAGNNLMGMGVLQAIKGLHISCPSEIAVVSFDDDPWTTLAYAPLTVIQQPAEEIGRRAAERALDINESIIHLQERLKGKMILRASCGCV